MTIDQSNNGRITEDELHAIVKMYLLFGDDDAMVTLFGGNIVEDDSMMSNAGEKPMAYRNRMALLRDALDEMMPSYEDAQVDHDSFKKALLPVCCHLEALAAELHRLNEDAYTATDVQAITNLVSRRKSTYVRNLVGFVERYHFVVEPKAENPFEA